MLARLNYAAVGRVLEAMKTAGADVPSDYFPGPTGANRHPLDNSRARELRGQLSFDISMAFTHQKIFKDAANDARVSTRHTALRKAATLAMQLVSIIEKESLPLMASLNRHLPTRGTDEILEDIRHLQSAARSEAARIAKRRPKAPLSRAKAGDGRYVGPWTTPGEALIATLAITYERAFGVSPTIQYDSLWEPRGGFVAFAVSVTSEADAKGIGMKPGAVRRAFDRWAKANPFAVSRARRRPSRGHDNPHAISYDVKAARAALADFLRSIGDETTAAGYERQSSPDKRR